MCQTVCILIANLPPWLGINTKTGLNLCECMVNLLGRACPSRTWRSVKLPQMRFGLCQNNAIIKACKPIPLGASHWPKACQVSIELGQPEFIQKGAVPILRKVIFGQR